MTKNAAFCFLCECNFVSSHTLPSSFVSSDASISYVSIRQRTIREHTIREHRLRARASISCVSILFTHLAAIFCLERRINLATNN